MSAERGLVRINLLDWRAAKREERQKNFFIALGGAALAGIAVAGLIIAIFNGFLDDQKSRNSRLQAEIGKIELQIQEIKELEKLRDDLIARTQVIEKLQLSRAETVHFFDELSKTIPEGLYLTKVDQKATSTQIDGVAESNGRVSSYIRNIEASEWLHDPRLIFIRAANDGRRRLSEFSLRVRVGPTKKKGAEEEEVIE